MDSVWIVIGMVDYGRNDILRAFSSQELAVKYVEKHQNWLYPSGHYNGLYINALEIDSEQ